MNGGSLFWVMDGPADGWPIVIYNWRGGYEFEKYPMPLVDFLVRWLSDELQESRMLPRTDAPAVKRDPVFCPQGSNRNSQRNSRIDE